MQALEAKNEDLLQEILLKESTIASLQLVAETTRHADSRNKGGPARSGESKDEAAQELAAQLHRSLQHGEDEAAQELAAQLQHAQKDLQVSLVLRGWEGHVSGCDPCW